MSSRVRACVSRVISVSVLCRTCTSSHFHSDPVRKLQRPLCQVQSYRRQHTASIAEDTTVSSHLVGHPWRIVSAICVQRMPSLCRDKSDIEHRYEELKDTLRMERSRKSDFELEEEKHVAMKRERQKRALEEDLDMTQAAKLEGSDEFEELQEAREAELQVFIPSSRETEADRTGDMRSLERKLDRVLYLLVKKPRNEHTWQMPQGGIEENESLAEAAKRELMEECGAELKVDLLSNTPWAFFSYTHPPVSSRPSGGNQVGTKVFFLKALYRGGEVKVDNKELVDYMWVTKEELKDYVSADYYNSVSPMLSV